MRRSTAYTKSAAGERGTGAGNSARRSASERTASARSSVDAANRAGTENVYRSARRTTNTNYNGGYRPGKKKSGPGAGVYAAIGAAALLAIGAGVFAYQHLSGAKAEEIETTEALAADAIRQNAVIDLSVLGGSAAQTGGTAAQEESGSAQSAETASSLLYIQGMTPAEIRAEIAKRYTWDMQITNEDADVGATVKPTVDANETTEAATMGDAENPDSDAKAARETAPAEITVADHIAVPDLIAARVDQLISKITAEEERLKEEAVSEAAESETAETKAKRKKAEESAAETEPLITYALSLDDADEEIMRSAKEAEQMWYKAPKGGSIGSYDSEKAKGAATIEALTAGFRMEGAQNGYEVDTDAVADSIRQALTDKEFDAKLPVSGKVLSSDAASSAARAEYKLIATYSTDTTNNAVRNKNIQIAAEKLNGTIVGPGEELSFNNAVGERTREKGYGEAAAYNNGEVVQEVGGGVCQVSTTLYNAVLRAGLKTTKRQSHTFKPTYVTPGFDATISWGGPDYRFANVPAIEEYSNQNSYSIGIVALYKDRKVTVGIYGRPVLKDGYSYTLESTKTEDIPVVRKLIEAGSDKQPTSGSMGSKWKTNLVVKKNGEVVSDKLDHNTYYSGHIEYYKEEAETAPSESESQLPTDTLGANESGSAAQSAEGPDGGPGATAATEQPTAPQSTQTETTAQAVMPSAQAPDGGPGSNGPGVISEGPGGL